jgi:hypothetical protein
MGQKRGVLPANETPEFEININPEKCDADPLTI